MKNRLGLFINPCLLELIISSLTPQPLPAVDDSVKGQKGRKKNPILLCQCCYHWSFPLYPLAVAVPVPWAGQGWRRGQRGREAEWEKVGHLWPQCPTSCSWGDITQGFASKSTSLFCIPESFLQPLTTFNLLDSPSVPPHPASPELEGSLSNCKKGWWEKEIVLVPAVKENQGSSSDIPELSPNILAWHEGLFATSRPHLVCSCFHVLVSVVPTP